jgi:hypothetical protein
LSISDNFIRSLRHWATQVANAADFDATHFSATSRQSSRTGLVGSNDENTSIVNLQSLAHAFNRASSYSNLPFVKKAAWY